MVLQLGASTVPLSLISSLNRDLICLSPEEGQSLPVPLCVIVAVVVCYVWRHRRLKVQFLFPSIHSFAPFIYAIIHQSTATPTSRSLPPPPPQFLQSYTPQLYMHSAVSKTLLLAFSRSFHSFTHSHAIPKKSHNKSSPSLCFASAPFVCPNHRPLAPSSAPLLLYRCCSNLCCCCCPVGRPLSILPCAPFIHSVYPSIYLFIPPD